MVIAELIKKEKIRPSDCLYHTNRQPLNKQKQRAGKIRVLVWKKEEPKARVEYICPECGHEEYTEETWKRPFSVKCSKCGYRIRVPKMKDAAKREMKGKA